MRTFVLGNEQCVLGFSLVGVDGQVIRSAPELKEALDESLADETIGLLLVTTDVAAFMREEIDNLKVSRMQPLVVEIPGQEGTSAYPSLAEFVQRAIGISLGEG